MCLLRVGRLYFGILSLILAIGICLVFAPNCYCDPLGSDGVPIVPTGQSGEGFTPDSKDPINISITPGSADAKQKDPKDPPWRPPGPVPPPDPVSPS